MNPITLNDILTVAAINVVRIARTHESEQAAMQNANTMLRVELENAQSAIAQLRKELDELKSANASDPLANGHCDNRMAGAFAATEATAGG